MNLVRLARAFAFGAPLAFLASAFVGPPDPFSQLIIVGVGLLLFIPAAYVSVADTGNARTLVAFFGTILVVAILGSVLVNVIDGGTGLRLVVFVVAVAFGALAAMQDM